jgi:hypothetical protein
LASGAEEGNGCIMKAQDIYEYETGRAAHIANEEWRGTTLSEEYISWLERIVERVAGMMNIVPAKESIYDHDDLEDLCDLFKRIT